MNLESAPASTPGGRKGIMSRKVAGVPVVYLGVAVVAILALVAYRMTSASDGGGDAPASDEPAPDEGGADVGYPDMPRGTVIVSPSQPETPEPVDMTNEDWLRKAVAFVMTKGVSPGDAQVALQHYLNGDDLTVAQGKIRDMAVREYGLPPDAFTAGDTAKVPPPTTIPRPGVNISPGMPGTVTKPKPTPAPKPSAPKTTVHVVRAGETLSRIAKKYGTTWQRIYAANRKVIGSNPNLIKPGQRLVIPRG